MEDVQRCTPKPLKIQNIRYGLEPSKHIPTSMTECSSLPITELLPATEPLGIKVSRLTSPPPSCGQSLKSQAALVGKKKSRKENSSYARINLNVSFWEVHFWHFLNIYVKYKYIYLYKKAYKFEKAEGFLLFCREMTKIHFSLIIKILFILYENFNVIDTESRMVIA